MTQSVESLRTARRPLGFHTSVTDSISEWMDLYKSKEDAHRERCTRFPEHRLLPAPSMDRNRAGILEQLIRDFFVSFDGWCPEEILAFALFACPRKILETATENGEVSQFLCVLHEHWKPSFLDWAYFLWEFTGRSCELFADVLILMPSQQKPDREVVGRVLFKTMVDLDLVHPNSCASFIGALLPHPYESTYARKHEEMIESYSKYLDPTDIGLICRSLVLYRSRDPEKCNCGYAYGEYECICSKKQLRQNPQAAPIDPLAFDLDKEYAAILLKLILDRNCVQVLEDELRWTREHRDEFIRSACEEVFSEAAYTEIYQNLNEGEFPRLKQRSPRQITDTEKRSNVTRSFDHDYNHTMANHGGCVSRGCKQAMKTDCANVSCKRHCAKDGRLLCKAHRTYTVEPLPQLTKRKRIFIRDERQIPRSRFTQEREGEDI